MAGTLYARFVPPKSSNLSSHLPVEPSILPRPDSQNGDSSKKSSKDKGERKKPARKKEKKKRKLDETEEQQEVYMTQKPKRSKSDQGFISKFAKSSKSAHKTIEDREEAAPNEDKLVSPEPELHDLVPLPQPEPAAEEEYQPNFSSLPSWLSKPLIVDPNFKPSFMELGLSERLVKNLASAKVQKAFPVQAALLPLQLPGVHKHYGDICVSAPTGSGKTLGYLLPIIEALKDQPTTQLRAIVVVPTRELVQQAFQEVEAMASKTHLQAGMAVGSKSLVHEQDLLIHKDQRYDPEAAAELHRVAQERIETGLWENDSLLDDIRTILPQHVPDYTSKVNLLICTPGRLVEHVRSTRGFSLADVEYLVVDEADRLLDDSFQEWVDVVLEALENTDSNSKVTPYLEDPKIVQKIILSATMTRDLGKLAALKLRRPTLVAVSGSKKTRDPTATESAESQDTVPITQSDNIDLPETLREVAIPVGNGGEKPLYLLQVLEEQLGFSTTSLSTAAALAGEYQKSTLSRSSSPLSEPRSTSDVEMNDADQVDEDTTLNGSHSGRSPRVLIFTNSNEDSVRLSHILSSMRPDLAAQIGTLTKTSSKSGRKTIRAFKKGKIVLLVASDRASRGLDITNLADVISYDMPRNQTTYVHRVGRTARAGRSGTAWSFFTNSEGRWFWNSIARSEEIHRPAGEVERMRVDVLESDERRKQYNDALESLKTAVLGTR